MSMKRWTTVLGTATFLAAAAEAEGAGFGLYEQGARALGTAGAFTARADDPSAIFFNPAGIAQLDAKHLLLSPNVIYYKSEFSGVAPYPGYGVEEETKGEYFPPFAAYYAQGIDKKVAAGVGVYSPYGLQVAWRDPASFTGRAISTLSKITPFYIVPSAAWAPSPSFRVGAGATIVLSKVELQRYLQAYNPIDDRTDDIGTIELESATNSGVGYNAGVQWWPGDARWKLGATYRSQVRIDYWGAADFEQIATGTPAFDAIVAAGFPPDQRVDTHDRVPGAGLARRGPPVLAGVVRRGRLQLDGVELVRPPRPAVQPDAVAQPVDRRELGRRVQRAHRRRVPSRGNVGLGVARRLLLRPVAAAHRGRRAAAARLGPPRPHRRRRLARRQGHDGRRVTSWPCSRASDRPRASIATATTAATAADR